MNQKMTIAAVAALATGALIGYVLSQAVAPPEWLIWVLLAFPWAYLAYTMWRDRDHDRERGRDPVAHRQP